MYVYDSFFGADKTQEAISIAKQFQEFLMVSGFPLRKWAANDLTLLAHRMRVNIRDKLYAWINSLT